MKNKRKAPMATWEATALVVGEIILFTLILYPSREKIQVNAVIYGGQVSYE